MKARERERRRGRPAETINKQKWVSNIRPGRIGRQGRQRECPILEFFGGIAIMLGLFTRPVALILSGTMAVAYWQFHAPQGRVADLEPGDARRPVVFHLPLRRSAGRRRLEPRRSNSSQTRRHHEYGMN
jgi:hypothetical protein